MIKWFRKLRYGDTSETPKYINKKGMWLFKNQWRTTNEILLNYKASPIQYYYSVNIYGKTYTEKAYSFEELLEAVIRDPENVKCDSSRLSISQLVILSDIQKTILLEKYSKVTNKMKKLVKDWEKGTQEWYK